MKLDYMFKGYIESKNKIPTHKYTDSSNLITYERARKLDSFSGILNDDYVVVDVDEPEAAKKLYTIVEELDIQCNVLQTTRGMHFYFVNTDLNTNKINRPVAIGINLDIGVGLKNKPVVLKDEGANRKWLKQVNNAQKIPKWLVPIKYDVSDFTNLSEGDGRNQKLFNYILTLQQHGFSKDEVRETIRIINKHIIKSPLKDHEVETILRDEAFQKAIFMSGKTLLHNKFAEFIKVEESIIKIDGVLHVYKDGIYVPDSYEIERSMIKHVPELTKSKRFEILSYLELIAKDKELTSPDLVPLKNGVYNIKTDSLIDFNTSYVFKNKVPVTYREDAYDKTMDITLNKICCKDMTLRLLIEEMIGYTLLRRNELGKCFILTGTGKNGKSTLLDVIQTMLGGKNVSAIGLEELDDRFKTAELYGKLANIGDDISNQYIENNATFKKLVTGEPVNVERKGKDPFEFRNYAKLIFSANEIPRINDTSQGHMRRLVIVPFNASFSKGDLDFDPFIKDKLLSPNALEYLLQLAIDGLHRILKANGFTEVKAVEAEIAEYEKINNPLLAFLDEVNIENQVTDDIYLRYSEYCAKNRLKQLSKAIFCRDVCKLTGLKTKWKMLDSKRYGIFMKVNE